MRAVLAEDWPLGQAALVGDLGATGSVRVRHTHPFWVNPAGELLDVSNESNMVVTVEARDVRPASDGRLTARPTLSVFVVRWGGEHTKFNNEEWGGAGASVSEQYIEWFLDRCVYATLGPDYEVLSAFIESGADMARLMAGLLPGRHRGPEWDGASRRLLRLRQGLRGGRSAHTLPPPEPALPHAAGQGLAAVHVSRRRPARAARHHCQPRRHRSRPEARRLRRARRPRTHPQQRAGRPVGGGGRGGRGGRGG